MKNIWYFLLFVLLFGVACSTTQKSMAPGQKVEVIIEDSLEYELIVMDPKFETFLLMQPSKDFYSQGYYENWNQQYIIEWNIRHSNPLKYGDFYQTEIEYDNSIDYGPDLNYRLYNYFRFIEKEYGIVLINRGR